MLYSLLSLPAALFYFPGLAQSWEWEVLICPVVPQELLC